MNNFGIPLEEEHSDCDGIRGRTRTQHAEGEEGGKKRQIADKNR